MSKKQTPSKATKRSKKDTLRAVEAINLINRLCACMKNKRRPMLVMEKKTGKLVSFTFEQAVGAVFEAMTGISAVDWIVPTPDKTPDKQKRKGGA